MSSDAEVRQNARATGQPTLLNLGPHEWTRQGSVAVNTTYFKGPRLAPVKGHIMCDMLIFWWGVNQ